MCVYILTCFLFIYYFFLSSIVFVEKSKPVLWKPISFFYHRVTPQINDKKKQKKTTTTKKNIHRHVSRNIVEYLLSTLSPSFPRIKSFGIFIKPINEGNLFVMLFPSQCIQFYLFFIYLFIFIYFNIH